MHTSRAQDADRNSLPGLSQSRVCFPQRDRKKFALVGPGSWLLGHVPVTPPSTTQNLGWQRTSEIGQPSLSAYSREGRGAVMTVQGHGAREGSGGHSGKIEDTRARLSGTEPRPAAPGTWLRAMAQPWPPSPPLGAGAAAYRLSSAEDKMPHHSGHDTPASPGPHPSAQEEGQGSGFLSSKGRAAKP